MSPHSNRSSETQTHWWSSFRSEAPTSRQMSWNAIVATTRPTTPTTSRSLRGSSTVTSSVAASAGQSSTHLGHHGRPGGGGQRAREGSRTRRLAHPRVLPVPCGRRPSGAGSVASDPLRATTYCGPRARRAQNATPRDQVSRGRAPGAAPEPTAAPRAAPHGHDSPRERADRAEHDRDGGAHGDDRERFLR